MLNDTDLWPITCAECGKIFEKEIGWLKHSTSVVCPKCRSDLAFRNDTFLQILENAKGTLAHIASPDNSSDWLM